MSIPLEPADPRGESPEGSDELRRITAQVDAERKREHTLASVKRVVAIHSGKGGVGKTFLTVNLAYALEERGLDVAILDADVDCPNVPKFLGMTSRLFVDKDKRFIPVNHRGVPIVSMGLTRDDEAEPFLIRGPAKHRVAIDLLMNTDWGALDILLIDLPPGTADVPLSLFEFGGVEAVLFVTSPQKEAITDTRKSIRMAKTFGTHILGIVENMSGEVFGTGKAAALAIEEGIPFLGSIPLSAEILAANERGDTIFTDVSMEEIVKPILDAIIAEGH